jgi:23S rRNA (adenine1618-N6)-methyltransferase
MFSGAGASCIYPLLGTTVRQNWKFCGTELDEKNYVYAKQNVLANDLSSRIKLIKVPGPGKILPNLNILGIPRADFTMCNPPFYTSQEDMRSMWSKAEPPSAVCTGAGVEMITEGGDEGFVLRMVDESRLMNVQWYSSMLGKLNSVRAVVARLKDIGCRNWVVGTLNTGGKTRRWVVGWSWGDFRPLNVSALKRFPADLVVNA